MASQGWAFHCSACRMRDPFIPGDGYSQELPLMEEKRTPVLGIPCSCFPRLLCLYFGSPLMRANVVEEQAGLLRILCHWDLPQESQKHRALPKGGKQQRKSPVFSPNGFTKQLSLTFRYSQNSRIHL